tara:strand:- start:3868 stop:10272 length:6405 start_codon:yes stop_codon:yes gene_type:complete
MPEIKHTFQAGKMNKDLDERLVPNGEYRDAINVQVRTSDGDDIGTAQNIQGNTAIGGSFADYTPHHPSYLSEERFKQTVVASIADEKTDKVYFFFASSLIDYRNEVLIEHFQRTDPNILFIDAIIEQHVDGTTLPVVVDNYAIVSTWQEVFGDTYNNLNADDQNPVWQLDIQSSYVNKDKIRPGMIIRIDVLNSATNIFSTVTNQPGPYGNNFGQPIVQSVSSPAYLAGGVRLTFSVPLSNAAVSTWEDNNALIWFLDERVLNFSRDNVITGVNIIDNLLFWTDNSTEPKKVNIDRSKAGTELSTSDEISNFQLGLDPDGNAITSNIPVSNIFDHHTKVFCQNPNNVGIIDYMDVGDEPGVNPTQQLVPSEGGWTTNSYLKERHITTIRRAPRTAPTLEMYEDDRDGLNTFNIDWVPWTNPVIQCQGTFAEIGSNVIIEAGWNGNFTDSELYSGDIVVLTQTNVNTDILEPVVIKVKFQQYQQWGQDPNNPCDWVVPNTTGNAILATVLSITGPLSAETNQWDVSLEKRKPLFELGFGRFGYRYKYEDGEYSSFSPWSELAFLPGEFDYKPKKGYNLGMTNIVRKLIVKGFVPTNRPLDMVAVDILYKKTDSPNVYVVKSIKRGVDDEWELFDLPQNLGNDPTYAQSVTGQLQITSEMIHKVLPANQTLRAWDNVPRYALGQEIVGNRLVFGNYVQGYNFPDKVELLQNLNSYYTPTPENPEKSVKSIRNYKWGMVFGDKYGRETPVIASGYTTGSNASDFETVTGDTIISKSFAQTKNVFDLQQSWPGSGGGPPSWADYVKYYVKETSNEYYNLILDYWYWADEHDANVWLSFPSADRNKVDEETYLILKNKHDTQEPIEDKARYKIIAIESDAPDFIKTYGKSLGRVEIHKDNTGGAAAASGGTMWSCAQGSLDLDNPAGEGPENLMNRTHLIINRDDWRRAIHFYVSTAPDGSAGASVPINIFGREVKGGIRMRLCAEEIDSALVGDQQVTNRLYSSYRTLYTYNLIGAAGDGPDDECGGAAGYPNAVYVEWDEAWEQEAHFQSRFLAAGLNITDPSNANQPFKLYVEFEEVIVENKPQFDGRFFCKVEVDSDLRNNVLYTAGESADWKVIRTFDVRYIETAYQNEGVAGSGQYAAQSYSQLLGSTFSSFSGWTGLIPGAGLGDLDQYFASCDLKTQTWEFWYDFIWSISGPPTAQDSGIIGNRSMFLDGANYRVRWEAGGTNQDNYGKSIAMDYDPDCTNCEPGHLTRMTLSYLDAFNMPFPGSNSGTLFSDMIEVGTRFRWSLDGEQKVYEIVNIEVLGAKNFSNDYPYWDSSGIPDLIAEAQGDCSYCGSEVPGVSGSPASFTYNPPNNVCRRHTRRISFRYVNIEGVTVLTEGLDPNEFDPRGQMPVDGRAVEDEMLRIQLVMEPESNAGYGSEYTQTGACWETEPKEDVGLDLYYEASNAVPTVLNENNIYDYIPIGTQIGLQSYINGPEIPLSNMDATGYSVPVDTVWVEQIYWADRVPILRIRQENPGGDNIRHRWNILPGHAMSFHHPDGTITRSEVLNIYALSFPQVLPTENYWFYQAPMYDALFIWNPPANSNPGQAIYHVLEPIENTVPNMTQFENIYYSNEEAIGTKVVNQAGQTIDSESILPNATNITNFYNPGDTVNGVQLTDGGIRLDNDPLTQGVLSPGDVVAINVGYERTGYYAIDPEVWKYPITLGWHNCYSFGNGVESDRIRDDFNAPQIDNGIKVSSTFTGYKKEDKSSGMIYSGLYNSTSGVNDLNEFNMAEKITKDLNPAYGSIQALKTRDTDIVVLTEDKVLKVLANKDALYNADGNPQLTATNRVLGTATPFSGDYGISKNPESLAWDQFRIYFADMQRGAVLRLSMDGLTPISNVGMKTWFRDNLKQRNLLLGTFDTVNGEYNLTMKKELPNDNPFIDKTISFNEGSKGWVSFKSFIPQSGKSVSGKYLTAKNSEIYEHYKSRDQYGNTKPYNSFYTYGSANSSITVMFNANPGDIKSFKTMNYEGSQARIVENTEDEQYYNLTSERGWWVPRIFTDLDHGQVPEFINKENKWFNRISGILTNQYNLDEDEFTVQGIGSPSFAFTQEQILENEPFIFEVVDDDWDDQNQGQYIYDNFDEDEGIISE